MRKASIPCWSTSFGAFDLRRQARDGEKAQLEERIVQLREQVTGLEQQAQAMDVQVETCRCRRCVLPRKCGSSSLYNIPG